jgi:hypothetical protein
MMPSLSLRGFPKGKPRNLIKEEALEILLSNPIQLRETRLPLPTAKAVRLASMGIGFLWIIRLLLPYGFVLELPFLKPLDYESA